MKPKHFIKLHKDDYTDHQLEVFDLYYDPEKDKYETIQRTEDFDDANYCPDFGYHLGGYLIEGCKLRFIYPTSDTVEYIRPYSDEFSDGYVDDTIVVDKTGEIIAFSADFNLDFKTLAELVNPIGGDFAELAFSTAFNNDNNI